MKKILFTTAYSNSSKNTWRYALKIAQHYDAQITLMHVYQLSDGPNTQGQYFLEDQSLQDLVGYQNQSFSEEEEGLIDFAMRYTPKDFHQIPLSFIVDTSKVTTSIIQTVQRNKYDLLIMGTSTSLTSNRLFGNNSTHIMKEVSIPVLLVPPMANYTGINKIIYTSNFESKELKAIQFLLEWTRIFKAKLHLLYLKQNSLQSEETKDRMQKLMMAFEEQSGTLSFETIQDDISKNMEDYILLNKADMVALSTHKRGFFQQLFKPDITNKIAKNSLVPVLIINS